MRLHRFLLCLLLTGALASPAAAAARRMFVTSVNGTGDLSTWADAGGHTGVAAGDAICQARAAAAGLPNAAAYRAWLSDTNDDAYCRLHQLPGKKADNCGQPTLPAAAGPWWRTDGPPFGAGLPELLAPVEQVLNPPRYDELGHNLGIDGHWTGTAGDGAVVPDTCSGWTSAAAGTNGTSGSTYQTSVGWTNHYAADCATTARLACFETGVGDPLPVLPAWGRLAFLTSAHGTGDLGGWPAAGGANGIAAGDAICQSLAAAAGVRQPESFKAWLSDAATDAIDRFQTDGPWMRLDGIRVASSKADLTDLTLASSIHLTELGDYLSNWAVWTGTLGGGIRGQSHCAGWTAGASGTGEHGSANNAIFQWTQMGTVDCSFEWTYLYCLQDLPLVFLDGFETGNRRAWSMSVP